MKISDAKQLIFNTLPEKRREHSLRVTKLALKLADRFKANKREVELAAILHDYAKNHSNDELKTWIIHSSLPKNLLFYSPAIWHGPVGALMLKQKYGIINPNVLSAIYSHTTGKENMSIVDKIIYVADYIEPAREFPGVQEVRKAAKQDINLATYFILRNTIKYLIDQKHTIYPSTLYAYNDLTEIVKKDGGYSNK